MGFHWLYIPLLFVVAGAYASVGLGGGTAYLALLSFSETDPAVLRPMAWALNVMVTTSSVLMFRKKGHLRFSETAPYLGGGLVGAVLGASITLGKTAFLGLLAVTLSALAVRMLFVGKSKQEGELRKIGFVAAVVVGFCPGFLSGIVGIGGGIILGPILLALSLMTIKKMAGVTAIYIWTTSLAALVVHFVRGGTLPWADFAIFAVVVLAGGTLGAAYGAGKADPRTLQRIFGVIVLSAALNLGVKFVRALF